MDLSYSPEELAFQGEVRSWLKKNVPQRQRDERPMDWGDARRIAQAKAWQRKVYDAGYLALGWPKEYGGQGADVMRQTIVNEEMVRARAPGLVGMMGIQMVGPTLIQHGTEEQRRRHLPKILGAEEVWCQGYSEPGAGSDLAGLQTRAVRDGDDYILNGQKIWTSYGDKADSMFILVRTDFEGAKHGGITFLLMDMETPGVTVRPIRLISGASPFCEVFLSDVRVPAHNVVGRVNGGWRLAKALLGHERTMIADAFKERDDARRLVELARRYVGDRNGRVTDPIVRDRITQVEMDQACLDLTLARARDGAKAGHRPGPESSIFKLYGTELNQRRRALMVEILGPQALGWEGPGFADEELLVTRDWLRSRGNSIEGGTSEIQLNIIAKRVLGLPD